MTQTQPPPAQPPTGVPPAQQAAPPQAPPRRPAAARRAAARPAGAGRAATAAGAATGTGNASASARRTRWADRGPGSSQREHALEDLRQKMHQFVIHELGPILYDQRVCGGRPAPAGRRAAATARSRRSASRSPRPSASSSCSRSSTTCSATGRSTSLLRETRHHRSHGERPDQRVRRARAARSCSPTSSFVDETHLRRIIDKIVSQVGRRVDEATPMVDARLPDGSRVNVIVHPLAIGGPFMTIRKFSKDPYTVDDLISFGSFTPQVAHFINAVRARPAERRGQRRYRHREDDAAQRAVVFIPERRAHRHRSRTRRSSSSSSRTCSRLEARPPNIEGKGEVRIRDLVRNSLRMRPDRIVVGEVRGGEALDMLQAMNTGHDGSITTVHSNSPRDTLSRIETMTLMAGMDLPVRVIREQMASALDLDRAPHPSARRHAARHPRQRGDGHGGRRGRAPGHLHVRLRRWASTRTGGSSADLKSTGIRPSFSERLADYGISLEPSLFAATERGRRAAVARPMNARCIAPRASPAADEDRLRGVARRRGARARARGRSSCRRTSAATSSERLG